MTRGLRTQVREGGDPTFLSSLFAHVTFPGDFVRLCSWCSLSPHDRFHVPWAVSPRRPLLCSAPVQQW